MAGINHNDVHPDVSTVLKAVKAFCIECNGYDREEVKRCTSTVCPLYYYRFGRNEYPDRKKRTLTEEQKEQARERMKNVHRNKTIQKIENEKGVDENE